MASSDKQGFSTRQIHTGHPHVAGIAPLATPIFQTSTFVFDNTEQGARRFAGEEKGYIYTRLGNPNSDEVAAKVANLEGAEAGFCMSSGMGAVSSTMWTLLHVGDHLLADENLYGCTFAYFMHGLTRYGVEVTLTDLSKLENIEKNMRDNTAVVYFETPANPSIKIIDIEAVSNIVHARNKNAKVVVDNTFSTPYLQRPLKLGADVVLHSATKYLNGHGDVVAGVVVSNEEIMQEIAMFGVKDMTGSPLGPFEAFLINRGLKTLDIRMDKHCKNAMEVAKFLEGHKAVKRVLYPGLESHPQHEIAKKQMDDFGGMISFELNATKAESSKFINELKLCALAVSLGDAETLIEHPASMTHSAYSPEELAAAGIPESLIRLSVGLECVEDIIADLKEGLDKLVK